MSDCTSCGQPPCICRCAYWDAEFLSAFGEVDLKVWRCVLGQIETMQLRAAVLADKAAAVYSVKRLGGLAKANAARRAA